MVLSKISLGYWIPDTSSKSRRMYIIASVVAALWVFALPGVTQAGILYHSYGGSIVSPTIGHQFLTGLPRTETFQINAQNEYISGGLYTAPFTYSAKMGIYEGVTASSIAHIIPPGMFELSTDAPAPGLRVVVAAHGEGRLIGKDLITTAAMRFWGKLAPGDELEYSFSGGTQDRYADGRRAGVYGNISNENGFIGTLSGFMGPNTPAGLIGRISSNGEFFVDFLYTSDLYATGPYGIDATHYASFSLGITRYGTGTGKSTVSFDPGAGTFERGTNPDFPFIPPAVPEPSTLTLFAGFAASFLAFRRRGELVRLAHSRLAHSNPC